ncbi:hypothetical protein [Streptomyces sp. NPDC001815]|uniref:hypothetical protein n=1 Tax=Streptomyces sp. NPDC001815 TaxID=3154526 RepID=UPI0033185572
MQLQDSPDGAGGNMNRRLGGLAGALVLAAVSTTAGCFARYSPCPGEGHRPDGLVGRDLAGTYRDAAERSVTLKGDGTFTTAGWPTDLEGAKGPPEQRDGSGTWELTSADSAAYPLSLTFHTISDYGNSREEGGYYGTGLYVDGSRQAPRLYEYRGDPDLCDVNRFERAN